MPNYVINHHYHLERGPHNPHHRSASRPPPILKAAAKAVKGVFSPDQGHAAHADQHHHRGHTRATSVPIVTYTVRPGRRHEEHRGRDRDHRDRHEIIAKESVYHKEDRHREKRREPSKHREFRAEEPKRDPRREEHRRAGHRPASVQPAARRVDAPKPLAQRRPANAGALPPQRPQRRADYDVDNLARKFGDNLKVTMNAKHAHIHLQPPARKYYQPDLGRYPPPPLAPQYAPPRAGGGRPALSEYAPAVYNAHYH